MPFVEFCTGYDQGLAISLTIFPACTSLSTARLENRLVCQSLLKKWFIHVYQTVVHHYLK